MALGALPDLLAINTELGLTLQGLNECITESGEAFTSQLDFANWSAPVDVTVTYDLSTTITTKTSTSSTVDKWRRVDILPAGSGRSGAVINCRVSYVLNKGTGLLTDAIFYYGIGTSSTAEPSWIQVNSANTGGTLGVDVADGEYLFVRLVVTKSGSGTTDWASADITLINGTVVAPDTGTVTASGSPLDWIITIGAAP